ncbi:MAG: hypothetical protein INR62_05295 [Rhodospirillales bacterium]|nr:hypothetical protein [Acetobacter sp.]
MAASLPSPRDVNNPLRILRAVDARLTEPFEFFLFGRAALVLGFADPPAEAAATQDVDGIIPRELLAGLQANDRWWTALEAANEELATEGLYLTHLFDEEQIILRANWHAEAVAVPAPDLRFLKLRRPATIDLILTKMMRGLDPDDMADVRFYLEREPRIGVAELQTAFASAVGPDVPEIWQLFAAAKPAVLSMAQEVRSQP